MELREIIPILQISRTQNCVYLQHRIVQEFNRDEGFGGFHVQSL